MYHHQGLYLVFFLSRSGDSKTIGLFENYCKIIFLKDKYEKNLLFCQNVWNYVIDEQPFQCIPTLPFLFNLFY